MEIILTIFLNFGIHSEKAEVKEYVQWYWNE